MKKLQKAINDLNKCHRATRKELAKIDDLVIREFLGEFYSPELKQNMLKYGDGHVLYSLPRSTDELNAVDAVILIAATSPKLSVNSDFNPSTPLHTIPYWRDGKGLSPITRSTRSGREYRLHFMSWQQNFAIHGKDDSHARKNRRLLLSTNPRFEMLFQKEEGASIEFIKRCKDWVDANGKTMVLVAHTGRSNFNEPILSLKAAPDVIHINANLRGTNYQIMGRIRDKLS